MLSAEAWRGLPWVADRRAIHEWAADNFILPAGLGRSGRFDPTISRHFLAPLDALKSDRIREVNICAPPRSGKTLIGDLFVPWMICNDPGSCLTLFENDGQAKLHCENRLMPSLKRVPAIREMLPTGIKRHQLRTTQIKFTNDLYLHAFGTALGNLQARGYRVVICDEVWNWEPGRLIEAKARMGDFLELANYKLLVMSQAGEEGAEDQWEEQFHSADICEWQIPCLACGHMQQSVWSGHRENGERWGIVYQSDRTGNGEYDIKQAMETVRFECRQCGHKHENRQKTRALWNVGGAYDRVIESGKVSFHWNDVIDKPWDVLVEDWLRARMLAHRHSYTALKSFFHKRLAEFASERSVQEASSSIPRAEINMDEKWGAVRYMTVDVQQHGKLWVMVRAWARGGESRRLHWSSAQGWAEIEKIRESLNVQPKCVFVDCNFEPGSTFAAIINGGYWGVRGEDRGRYTHNEIDPKTRQVVRRVEHVFSPVCQGDPDSGKVRVAGSKLAPFFKLCIPEIADSLAGLIRAGLWIDPIVAEGDEAEKDYVAQMSAEGKKKFTKQDGSIEYKWHKFNQNNHATDLARYQVFAATAAGLI